MMWTLGKLSGGFESTGSILPLSATIWKAIVPAMPDAVRLPKIQTPEDVESLEQCLCEIEREKGIEVGERFCA